MKAKEQKYLEIPEVSELEEEYQRVQYRSRTLRVLRDTIFTLITVAAIAILVATMFMPVLRIYGTSMVPTLTDGDYVISVKTGELETGDIIAFYYNNKILVKRVIAHAGQWVDIDEEGYVYVDQVRLEEPYVMERALGETDIELPYQVPEGRWFVMGDHRSVSVDSRSTAVGCVAEDQVVGRLVYKIWPWKDMKIVR